MDQQTRLGLIQALQDLNERLERAGTGLTRVIDGSYAERERRIEQKRQFNTVAGRWQETTAALIQVLQENMGNDDATPTAEPPTQAVAREGRRVGLTDRWQATKPMGYTLWGGEYVEARSKRKMYTQVLEAFRLRFGESFIAKVLAHKQRAGLQLQQEPNTYTTPFVSIDGYAFNTNLDAENLRDSIAFMYDAFGVDRGEFGMWVE